MKMGVYFSGPLKIVAANPNPKCRIGFDDTNLKELLTTIGDRKVAIFSISGSPSGGKSFFLNFLLRYFVALSKDEPDWMGWSKREEKLVGFPWGNHDKDETDTAVNFGLLFWTIICKRQSDEVAIILIDTFGKPKNKEESDLLSLFSLLLASCKIQNIFHSLEEENSILDFFIETARLKTERDPDCEDRPFQKHLFLVRDWEGQPQFPFGLKGGNAYMKTEMKNKLLSLEKTFSEVQTCLLPKAGEDLASEQFDGSINQLNPIFCKKIEELVTDLLDPDYLPLKSIYGMEIEGSNLEFIFTELVELFNEKQLPRPKSVLGVFDKVYCKLNFLKALGNYAHGVQSKINESGFLSTSKLREVENCMFEESRQMYNSAKNCGNLKIVKKFENMMLAFRNDNLEEMFAENEETKKQIMLSAFQNAREAFTVEAIKALRNLELSGNSTEELQIQLKQLKDSILCDVAIKLTHCEDVEVFVFKQNLMRHFATIEKRVLIDCKHKIKKLEFNLDEKISLVGRQYGKELENLIGEKGLNFSDTSLKARDKELRAKLIQDFRVTALSGIQGESKEKYLDKLCNNLQSQFSNAEEKLKKRIDDARNQADTTIADISLEIGKDFRDRVTQTMAGFKKECDAQLRSRISNVPRKSELWKSINAKLSNNLEESFLMGLQDIVKELEEKHVGNFSNSTPSEPHIVVRKAEGAQEETVATDDNLNNDQAICILIEKSRKQYNEEIRLKMDGAKNKGELLHNHKELLLETSKDLLQEVSKMEIENFPLNPGNPVEALRKFIEEDWVKIRNDYSQRLRKTGSLGQEMLAVDEIHHPAGEGAENEKTTEAAAANAQCIPEESSPNSEKLPPIAIEFFGEAARMGYINETGEFEIILNNFGKAFTVAKFKISNSDYKKIAIGEEDMDSPYSVVNLGELFHNLKPGNQGTQVERTEYYASLFLRKLKADAETQLRGLCQEAFVTVPLSFTSVQRKVIKYAAEAAGFINCSILNDTTAAVLFFANRDALLPSKNKYNILVSVVYPNHYDAAIYECREGQTRMLSFWGNKHACTQPSENIKKIAEGRAAGLNPYFKNLGIVKNVCKEMIRFKIDYNVCVKYSHNESLTSILESQGHIWEGEVDVLEGAAIFAAKRDSGFKLIQDFFPYYFQRRNPKVVSIFKFPDAFPQEIDNLEKVHCFRTTATQNPLLDISEKSLLYESKSVGFYWVKLEREVFQKSFEEFRVVFTLSKEGIFDVKKVIGVKNGETSELRFYLTTGKW